MALQIVDGFITDVDSVDYGYISVEYMDQDSGAAQTMFVQLPAVMYSVLSVGEQISFAFDPQGNHPNRGIFINYFESPPTIMDELSAPVLENHTHKLFSNSTLNKMLPNITDPNMKQDMINQTTGEVIKWEIT